MAFDPISYALSKSYVDATLQGAGALKGASCRIASITKVEGGNSVEFVWEADGDAIASQTMFVADGVSPTIAEALGNTDQIYKLVFTTPEQTFTTQNLRGQSPTVVVRRNASDTGYEIVVTDINGTRTTTIPDTDVDWEKLEGKPFVTLNPNDFVVTNGVLSSTAISEWDDIENKPFETLDTNIFRVTNGKLSAEIPKKWDEIEERPFYNVDGVTITVNDNMNLAIADEIVTEDDLVLLKNELEEQIDLKADKDVVGTFEETGMATVEGVTNIATAVKKINSGTITGISYANKIITITTSKGDTYTADISALITNSSIGDLADVNIASITDKQLLAYDVTSTNFLPVTIDLEEVLRKANLYTDEQIATIQEAEAISVDAKPTFSNGIITYIKGGETFTTPETKTWFYYYDAEGVLVQTIWIDNVEYTITVGDIDLTEYVKKEDIAMYDPDVEQQVYLGEDVASMGMVDYFVGLLKTLVQSLNVNGVFADTTGKFAVDATNVPRPDIVEIETAEDGSETEVRTPRLNVELSLEAIEERLDNVQDSLYAGENITIAEKTIEEQAEDGTVTTRDVTEISAGVVNVIEADELPAVADMKPTQLYAQYGNQDDGFFYRWDAVNETVIKYPADDILIVENLPSYMVARKDRLYRSYTTDTEGNKVLRDTYYFVLQSELAIAWQSISFENIVDVEGSVLPENMNYILLYRLMGVKDTGELYRYSDKEEKTFAYIPEDKINSTYLRKDDLAAGSNITIIPSDDKNPTTISATVLTKVLELPEDPDKNNIYQTYNWVPNYSDMRALSSGGGLSYYYGFKDVDTLPTTDEYPDEHYLYRLPDDETMYGWDYFLQDWRTYTLADMKFVEIMPESYEAVSGVLYVDADMEIGSDLYIYSGAEWFKYTTPDNQITSMVQVYELPTTAKDNVIYQLLKKQELEQYAFFTEGGEWRVFTSLLTVPALPSGVIDETAIYLSEANDTKYYWNASTSSWENYPTDYAVEYVESLPEESEAQQSTVYSLFGTVSTTGLHVCNNGAWFEYTPELTAGDNIKIEEGVISSKPIKTVFSLPNTADIDELYKIEYNAPDTSFAIRTYGGSWSYFNRLIVVDSLPTREIHTTALYQISGSNTVYWYIGAEWVSFVPVLVDEFPSEEEGVKGTAYQLNGKKVHPKIYSYVSGEWVGMEPEFYLGENLVMDENQIVDDPVVGAKRSRKLKALNFDRRTEMPLGTADDPIEPDFLYVDESKGATDYEASLLKRYAPDLTDEADGYLRYIPQSQMLKTFVPSDVWEQYTGSNGYMGNVDISTGTNSCFVIADCLMHVNFRALPANKATTAGWKSLGYMNIGKWGYDMIVGDTKTIRDMGNIYLSNGYQSLVLDVKWSREGLLFFQTYVTSSLFNTNLDMNFAFTIPVKKIEPTT